jgi:acyl-CoA thioester hydrolase
MSPLERRFTVRWSDVDANGHMRNTAYSEYGADVRIALFQEAGFTWKRFEEAGLGPVLLREEIDYLREAGLGEEVRVTLEAAGLSPDGARWKVRHRLYNAAGEEMARVTALGGFIDLAARKLVAPPAELAAGLLRVPRAADFEELKPLRR